MHLPGVWHIDWIIHLDFHLMLLYIRFLCSKIQYLTCTLQYLRNTHFLPSFLPSIYLMLIQTQSRLSIRVCMIAAQDWNHGLRRKEFNILSWRKIKCFNKITDILNTYTLPNLRISNSISLSSIYVFITTSFFMEDSQHVYLHIILIYNLLYYLTMLLYTCTCKVYLHLTYLLFWFYQISSLNVILSFYRLNTCHILPNLLIKVSKYKLVFLLVKYPCHSTLTIY